MRLGFIWKSERASCELLIYLPRTRGYGPVPPISFRRWFLAAMTRAGVVASACLRRSSVGDLGESVVGIIARDGVGFRSR